MPTAPSRSQRSAADTCLAPCLQCEEIVDDAVLPSLLEHLGVDGVVLRLDQPQQLGDIRFRQFGPLALRWFIAGLFLGLEEDGEGGELGGGVVLGVAVECVHE